MTAQGHTTYAAQTRVLICGLTSDVGKKLNGRIGTVISFDTEAERYVVQVDGEESPKRVKAINLQLLPRFRFDGGAPDGSEESKPADSGVFVFGQQPP